MGIWKPGEGGFVASNIALQNKDGSTTIYNQVKAVDFPTEDHGIQTFHDLMLLKPYYFKLTRVDSVVEIVEELNLLISSGGNYGIGSVVANTTVEEWGSLADNGNYFLGLLFTDKKLTPGEQYDLEYIFNTRGGV